MRAASCSFRALSGPGLPEGRLLICAAPDGGPRFRPSRPSAFPRAGSASPSTLDSTETRTSGPSKWPDSSGNCSNTFAATLSCSGTGERRTKGLLSESSSASTLVCTPTSSPVMLRNSTRMSLFGTTSSGLSPTARLRTCAILNGFFIRRSKGCGNPKNCFGLASTPLIFHGHDISITYA